MKNSSSAAVVVRGTVALIAELLDRVFVRQSQREPVQVVREQEQAITGDSLLETQVSDERSTLELFDVIDAMAFHQVRHNFRAE